MAFLRRYLAEDPEGLLLNRVEGSEWPVWGLDGLPSLKGFLLYLYPFQGPGPCESREAFFAQIQLARGVSGLEMERVVAFHHTSDCGLVLTGSGEGLAATGQPLSLVGWPQEVSGLKSEEAFHLGVQALSNGDARGAMVHFDLAIAQNPYRHQLHACVVAVCDYLDRPEELAIAVRVGLHYFPASATLHYMSALACFRFKDWRGVETVLEDHPEVAANFPARHRALSARLALRTGQWRKAAEILNSGTGGRATEVDSVLQHPSLQRLLGLRRALTVGAGMTGLGALLSLPILPLGGAALGTAALGLVLLRERVVSRRIQVRLAGTRRYLGLGLPKDLSFERGSS